MINYKNLGGSQDFFVSISKYKKISQVYVFEITLAFITD